MLGADARRNIPTCVLVVEKGSSIHTIRYAVCMDPVFVGKSRFAYTEPLSNFSWGLGFGNCLKACPIEWGCLSLWVSVPACWLTTLTLPSLKN